MLLEVNYLVGFALIYLICLLAIVFSSKETTEDKRLRTFTSKQQKSLLTIQEETES